MKTMSDRWRPEPKLCLHLQTIPHWEKLRPCDIHKLANLLKLRKACGPDGIPNECLMHLPRRPLVHLTLSSAVPFFKALEGNKIHNVIKIQ
jgi:hypothetical protein